MTYYDTYLMLGDRMGEDTILLHRRTVHENAGSIRHTFERFLLFVTAARFAAFFFKWPETQVFGVMEGWGG